MVHEEAVGILHVLLQAGSEGHAEEDAHSSAYCSPQGMERSNAGVMEGDLVGILRHGLVQLDHVGVCVTVFGAGSVAADDDVLHGWILQEELTPEIAQAPTSFKGRVSPNLNVQLRRVAHAVCIDRPARELSGYQRMRWRCRAADHPACLA